MGTATGQHRTKVPFWVNRLSQLTIISKRKKKKERADFSTHFNYLSTRREKVLFYLSKTFISLILL